MRVTGGSEEVELVAKRTTVLEVLADSPMHKPDLVEATDHSRSTVDRAVRDLEAAGFVERVDAGWATTVPGRLAAERYRSFLDEERTIVDAVDVLGALPHDCAFPASVLTDGRVETFDDYRLFERLAEQLRSGRHCRVVLPALADSRHLRLCHTRAVVEERPVECLAPPAVWDRVREEFPYLANELADAPTFTARRVEDATVGLVVDGRGSERDGPGRDGSGRDDPRQDGSGGGGRDGAAEPGTVTLFACGPDGVTGALQTASAAAVEWADARYESRLAGATEVDLRTDGQGVELATVTGGRVPKRLRDQGFVRVDDDYFDRREALAPTTAWRAGLGLPEVAAGYAFERTSGEHAPAGDAAVDEEGEDDERSLAGALYDRLRAGEDVALLGPPGSGKSTVCKRVADRWRAEATGTALYRESGRADAFEDVATLEAVLDLVPGPVLVVVEDAARPEASDVFEVVRSVRGRGDVVFLVDSRTERWRETADTDARLEAFRREALSAVHVGPLTEADCRRLVRRVEKATGETVELSVPALLADVRETTDNETATPAAVSLVCHRLARHLDGPAGTGGPTTLDEDVDRAIDALRAVGEGGLAVGVLVHALNAAGVGVASTYAYALAASPVADEATVAAALERMEGDVLFAVDGADEYRAVHETWSARFLERLATTADEATTRERFGRSVSALLALADEASRRERVAAAVDGTTPALDRVVASPGEWADETVTAVFGLCQRYPKLAPLFGTTDDPAVDLPAACSPETAVRCSEWRGNAYRDAGRLDLAESEFEALGERAADHPEADGESFRLHSLRGAADVAASRGDFEEALATAREGREAAEAAADEYERARFRLLRARVETERGHTDAAAEHCRAALETFRAVDAAGDEARAEKRLGQLRRSQGEHDEARERFERALSLARRVGDRQLEADVLARLGQAERVLGEYETGRTYLSRALDVVGELGDVGREVDYRSRLGAIAYAQGDNEAAREQFERSLALAAETGRDERAFQQPNYLANIAIERGDLEAGETYHRRTLELAREQGAKRVQSVAHQGLCTVDRLRGNMETASEQARRGLETAQQVDKLNVRLQAHNSVGQIEQRLANLEAAREHYETARDLAEELGETHWQRSALADCAVFAYRRGEFDEAVEYARAEQAIVPDSGTLATETRTLSVLALVALDRGDLETAGEHVSTALEACRTEGDDAATATHLITLARVRCRQGELEAAADAVAEAREIARGAGFEFREAYTTLQAGAIARAQGDLETATRNVESALETFREIQAPYRAAQSLFERGKVERARGDVAAAREWLETAANAYRDIESPHKVAEVAAELVEVCDAAGDGEAAAAWRETGERAAVEVGIDRLTERLAPTRERAEPTATD